jgi:hypothetical protein
VRGKIVILGIVFFIATIPVSLAKKDQACESSCANDVTTVYQFDPRTESCVKHFVYPCEPYACDVDGITCKTQCISDADCSQAGKCDTGNGRCGTISSFCKDAFTVELSNGQEQSCEPYKCIGGACQQQCVDDGDCAPEYICVDGHRCEQLLAP